MLGFIAIGLAPQSAAVTRVLLVILGPDALVSVHQVAVLYVPVPTVLYCINSQLRAHADRSSFKTNPDGHTQMSYSNSVVPSIVCSPNASVPYAGDVDPIASQFLIVSCATFWKKFFIV